MKTTEQQIPLIKMHQYLSEWTTNGKPVTHSLTFDEKDSKKRIYRIYISKITDEPVFEQEMDMITPISFSTIVSTASIKDEEFRGVIEKCIMLDKQIEEIKTPITLSQPQNQ